MERVQLLEEQLQEKDKQLKESSKLLIDLKTEIK
jgi:hypothetical protein